MYDEKADLLERQLKTGEISYSQYIDGLLQSWTDFYKDRKGMEEESQAALEAIVDTTKSGIEEQISALAKLNEQNAHPYEVEIEALEEAKEAQDEYYDSCIDSMQDKLDLLEEEQEQEEKLNDIEEKRLSLLEAERNMYKNIRLVYAGNGQWVQKAREEDLQAVKKAEDELNDEKNQTEIEKLQEEIDKLQKEKDQYDEGLDKEIENLNQQIKDIQAPINDLIDILELIAAEQYNVDPALISQLINSEKGKEALEDKNEDNKIKSEVFNNNTNNIDKKDVQEITDNTFSEMFDELEKNNKTSADNIKSLGIDTDKYITNTNDTNTAENSLDANKLFTLAETGSGKTINQNNSDTPENLTKENSQSNQESENGKKLSADAESNIKTIKNKIIPLSEYIMNNNTIPEHISVFANALGMLGANFKDNFVKTGTDSIDINKATKDSLDRVNPVSANIITTVNVNGDSTNSKELANTIAATCETKISQAFTAFGNTFTNGLKKKLYGNT